MYFPDRGCVHTLLTLYVYATGVCALSFVFFDFSNSVSSDHITTADKRSIERRSRRFRDGQAGQLPKRLCKKGDLHRFRENKFMIFVLLKSHCSKCCAGNSGCYFVFKLNKNVTFKKVDGLKFTKLFLQKKNYTQNYCDLPFRLTYNLAYESIKVFLVQNLLNLIGQNVVP